MQHVNITKTTIDEVSALQQIGRQTFFETFAQSNSEADMQKYLTDKFSTTQISREVSHPDSQFYIAWENGAALGYLKINTGTAQTELQDESSLEIERIYVLSAYHGKKIGQLLFNKALEIAQDLNKPTIWLGVWEQNTKAIRFYEKNGFVAFGKHIFKLGEDEQTDIMMKKTLNPMDINLQPTLENEHFSLFPLLEKDFDVLYEVASDREIWAQHPNKDRWQKDVFQIFFDGAIKSRGAFRIVEKETGKTVGSTRFYDYQAAENSIFIGYTFYAKSCWGKGVNPEVKALMLDYIFKFVDKVQFQIGADNIRSQIAICRLGAVKVDEQEVAYFGEAPKLNFVYEIPKVSWDRRNEKKDN